RASVLLADPIRVDRREPEGDILVQQNHDLLHAVAKRHAILTESLPEHRVLAQPPALAGQIEVQTLADEANRDGHPLLRPEDRDEFTPREVEAGVTLGNWEVALAHRCSM